MYWNVGGARKSACQGPDSHQRRDERHETATAHQKPPLVPRSARAATALVEAPQEELKNKHSMRENAAPGFGVMEGSHHAEARQRTGAHILCPLPGKHTQRRRGPTVLRTLPPPAPTRAATSSHCTGTADSPMQGSETAAQAPLAAPDGKAVGGEKRWLVGRNHTPPRARPPRQTLPLHDRQTLRDARNLSYALLQYGRGATRPATWMHAVGQARACAGHMDAPW
jgi:hypothetical protein